MIKHTIYPDKVVATYSEGDCWHETIAEYFNLDSVRIIPPLQEGDELQKCLDKSISLCQNNIKGGERLC